MKKKVIPITLAILLVLLGVLYTLHKYNVFPFNERQTTSEIKETKNKDKLKKSDIKDESKKKVSKNELPVTFPDEENWLSNAMAQTDNIYSSQDITDVKLYNDGYNNIIIIYVKKKPIDMFIMTYDSDHDEFFYDWKSPQDFSTYKDAKEVDIDTPKILRILHNAVREEPHFDKIEAYMR